MNNRRKAILHVIAVVASIGLGSTLANILGGRPIDTTMIIVGFIIVFTIGIFFKRKEIFSN